MSKKRKIDLSNWIARAKLDPGLYLERRATEVILHSIGSVEILSENIFLKGGTLMGVVYDSPRQTADLDFSATLAADKTSAEKIKQLLDKAFPASSARVGSPDLRLCVQSFELKPRSNKFESATYPAINMRIAYARLGTSQEKHLYQGNCPDVIKLDISFNEPVYDFQVININNSKSNLRAYSLIELLAEKYRAYLQQGIRNRLRRQDIYDIWLLASQFQLDEVEIHALHKTLLAKCATRSIVPTHTSIDDPDLRARASSEWDSMSLELQTVPDFNQCFDAAKSLYLKMPW